MPHRLLMVLAILIAIPGTGQNAFAQEAESDWEFNASIGWSWREIDGTLFTIKPPLTGLATTDSLGLGSSSEAEASIGMRWKRLGVRLDYLPSEFSGDGTLALALDFGNGPIIGGTAPVSTDINVTMTLANIEYDLLGRADMDWSVGVGFGSIDLDFTLMPETGPTVAIGNDLPFGYLTMTFTKRWQKFSATINVQGLSVDIEKYTIDYRSLTLAGAYTIYTRKKMQLDAFVGYRYVDFKYDFDDNESRARTNTDLRLTGPHIGLRIAW